MLDCIRITLQRIEYGEFFKFGFERYCLSTHTGKRSFVSVAGHETTPSPESLAIDQTGAPNIADFGNGQII
eukprot:4804086-Amphidinium_carterae.1